MDAPNRDRRAPHRRRGPTTRPTQPDPRQARPSPPRSRPAVLHYSGAFARKPGREPIMGLNIDSRTATGGPLAIGVIRLVARARTSASPQPVLLLRRRKRARGRLRRRHLLRTTRERLAQRPPDACPRRRAGVSAEPCPPRQCAAVARAAAYVALAAIRAITHVEGKAIRSSRRARRGAGCWLRRTMAPLAGADVEQPDGVAAGVGGPSSSHRERMPGWTSRWGRGSLGHTQDDHETFDRGRRCAPAVAVVGTRPGGALACRRERASARASGDAGLSQEQLRSGPRRVPATAQIRPSE